MKLCYIDVAASLRCARSLHHSQPGPVHDMTHEPAS